MEISVIIPVYNAEKYVRRAVESALQQEECGEVILIEDRSPDNAIKVCKKLEGEYVNVHLYQHKGNINKGPGPSRNLGVLKSKYEYVAFLDADDFYLPKRFKKAVEIIENDENIDGVFEPVGCVFESEEEKKRYYVTHSAEIAMVRNGKKSEDLYERLVSGKYGYIHLDGLVVKKEKFLQVGMIPDLRLHEDTILTFKLSLMCKLVPGEKYKPVALRQLHKENTITRPGIDFLKTRCMAYENCIKWMKDNNIDNKKQKILKAKYYKRRYRYHKKEGEYLYAIGFYIYYHILMKSIEKHLF